VLKDLLDHNGILDASNDFYNTTTFTTGLDVNGFTNAAKHRDVREWPILKTRLSRCAQVIDLYCSAGVSSSSATLVWLPLPRAAFVTNARCRLLHPNRGIKVRIPHETMSGLLWVWAPERPVGQGSLAARRRHASYHRGTGSSIDNVCCHWA